MPFSPSVKDEAKARAHYQCVMCQTPFFLDVHHLIKETNGGKNTIENACPLCPNCHTWFGHDLAKRREVEAKRDWWWDRCARIDTAQMTPPDGQRFDQMFQQYQAQQTDELLSEMKTFIKDQFRQQAEQVSSAHTITELIQASTGSTGYGSGAYGAGPYGGGPAARCPSCGADGFSDVSGCPSCGAQSSG